MSIRVTRVSLVENFDLRMAGISAQRPPQTTAAIIIDGSSAAAGRCPKFRAIHDAPNAPM